MITCVLDIHIQPLKSLIVPLEMLQHMHDCVSLLASAYVKPISLVICHGVLPANILPEQHCGIHELIKALDHVCSKNDSQVEL